MRRIPFTCLNLIILLSVLALTGCRGRESSFTDKGMESISAMEYETALGQFAQGQESGEDIRLIKRGEGIAYMGLFSYDEAITSFVEALQKGSWRVGPLEKDINYYLAAAFEKNNDLTEAIKVYDAITGMWPKEKMAYTLRGLVYLKNNDPVSAKKDFDLVIDAYPSDYDNLLDICNALEAAGQEGTARDYLQAALDRGDNSLSDLDKGRIYYHLKDYENARNSLEAARDSGPDAIYYLGRSYEALGDRAYSISVYQSFLSSGRTNPEILNQLGVCEMAEGDYQKAYDHFSQGLEAGDSSCHQSLLYNCISACEYMGNFSKAKELIKEYLELYPEDESARREEIFLSTR